MPQVFISYSRRDKDFVLKLHAALAAQSRDAWVDWEDIPPTADWWREIQGGIDSADSFIFVISPDSVRSEVCRREVDYAVTSNKRLIPLLYRDVNDPAERAAMHPGISSHNWIFFRDTDDFDTAVKLLSDALDTDLSYVRTHTRVLIRAREWDGNQRNGSYLLQGDDLKMAETWLAQAVEKEPAPTTLHAEYITASRQAAVVRQRRLLAGVTVALIISLALAVLSLLLFGEANVQRGIAWENANAAATAQNEAEAQAVIAQNNANAAATAERDAQNNAVTATFAQGEAEVQRNAAQQAATAVSDERYRAQSIALSGQSQVELTGPLPDRSALLALEAFRSRYTWQAERALAYAVRDFLGRFTLSGHSNEVTTVDWSPDSRRIVTASNDNTARIWDAEGNLLYTLSGHSESVTRALWSPDGRWIATSSVDGTAKIWNASTGTAVFTLSGHNDRIVNLAWSPDSRRIVTASTDNTARIWDAISGEWMATLSGHTGAVNNAVFSADGTRIVTASSDTTAKIWSAPDGTELFTLMGHRTVVLRAAFSEDGIRIVTASADNTARIWDATNGTELFILSGHTRRVSRAVWSPDGERIATASEDGTAKIWNAQTGELLRTMFGHTGHVTGLIWSPGGKRLITVSEDRTARIWDSVSGGQLMIFTGHSSLIHSAAWSPDGRFFATASTDGTARLWGVWTTAQNLINFARRCCALRILTDEENIQFGLPTPTLVAPPAEIASCPAAMPSRLYPGARGRVSDDDPTALNVRREPGTSSPRVGQVSPGQTFQVIDGPQCVENMAWFQIIYGISAVQGWVAEGQDEQYFVEPILP